ncbi:MAG: Hsp70 family protein [Tomitella sp.]|nr:Hsp70 family protein [Tomitella sp.]
MADGSGGAGRVFGIDLGTTYSAIAYIDETGKPTVVRNANNSETTPSVVQFETASNVVVGQVAKDSAVVDGDSVVSLIKREMGAEREYPFHGEVHTPESISAIILRQLAADAAAATDGPVEQVVITVPAYFGGREKEATKKAGLIAGLDVVGILPEPVAAAVHYDLSSGGADTTVLVFDLGGGTFDTTVIQVTASEIAVLCTDGDTNLGGADWDARLRDHLIDRFVAEAAPAESPRDDNEFLQDVAIRAEELKKKLSLQESRPVTLRFGGGTAKIEVTRAEFETMTADLMDRSIDIVKRTLDTLKEKAPDVTIDDVLLVGGSARMPVVRARLAEEFGWDPKLHDPDLAVAKGAALFALSRVVFRLQEEAKKNATSEQQGERAADRVVTDVARDVGVPEAMLKQLVQKRTRNVLPKAFGVRVWDRTADRDFVQHLAFANDPLPTGDRAFSPGTAEDNQPSVLIELYEQAGPVLSDALTHNRPLNQGSGVIDGIPPQPAGAPIDIVMAIDEDGMLQLHATERRSGKDLHINVTVGMTTEEIAEAIDVMSKISVTS